MIAQLEDKKLEDGVTQFLLGCVTHSTSTQCHVGDMNELEEVTVAASTTTQVLSFGPPFQATRFPSLRGRGTGARFINRLPAGNGMSFIVSVSLYLLLRRPIR